MSFEGLDPQLPAAEREELDRFATGLMAERPYPRASFRGDLQRHIAGAPVRRRLRRQAALRVATGVALLAVATFGANGIGPLAPQATSPGADQANITAQAPAVR